jgi:hypothetical protein
LESTSLKLSKHDHSDAHFSSALHPEGAYPDHTVTGFPWEIPGHNRRDNKGGPRRDTRAFQGDTREIPGEIRRQTSGEIPGENQEKYKGDTMEMPGHTRRDTREIPGRFQGIPEKIPGEIPGRHQGDARAYQERY